MAEKAWQQKAERSHLNRTQESERVSRETRLYNTLKAHLSDILPSARLHILNIPRPIQTPPLVDQYMSLWRTLFTQNTIGTKGISVETMISSFLLWSLCSPGRPPILNPTVSTSSVLPYRCMLPHPAENKKWFYHLQCLRCALSRY